MKKQPPKVMKVRKGQTVEMPIEMALSAGAAAKASGLRPSDRPAVGAYMKKKPKKKS